MFKPVRLRFFCFFATAGFRLTDGLITAVFFLTSALCAAADVFRVVDFNAAKLRASAVFQAIIYLRQPMACETRLAIQIRITFLMIELNEKKHSNVVYYCAFVTWERLELSTH